MKKEDRAKYQKELEKATAQDVLTWAVERFGAGNIALASSLGAEDQVLTHMLHDKHPEVAIFTLDTGRLSQESYDTMVATIQRYGFRYEVLFPNTQDVEEMESKFGPNSFYQGVSARKQCCNIRKIVPLKRKLATLKVWICGLRRDQALTRAGVEMVEWDEANGLFKVNPLADWSEKQVWDYIKNNDVPYNALHDKGYPSIGCAPCTRAVEPGADIRSGRWWWESAETKECGLHKKG